jgi:hypothetical protein
LTAAITPAAVPPYTTTSNRSGDGGRPGLAAVGSGWPRVARAKAAAKGSLTGDLLGEAMV